MARRRDQAEGEALGAVPPEFAEMFAGAPEHVLRARLRGWMAQKYGSEHADLFWLTKLAAEGDRETVRLDAIRHIHLLLYGKAPERVIVEGKKEPAYGTPEQLTPDDRTAAVLRVLHAVGALPAAAAAVRSSKSTDAEMEQVPRANAPDEGPR